MVCHAWQGIQEGATLPTALQVDPGTLSAGERKEQGIKDLPQQLEDALSSYEADDGEPASLL
jgi:glutamine synthetase